MKRAAFFFLLILVALSTAPRFASAFGVSPPFVNASTLLRGSKYEATVFLVRGDAVAPSPVRAIFDTPPEIRSWFSTDHGEEFTIPAGVQQFPLKVRIQVPKDAPYGIYSAYLRVNTAPAGEAGKVSVSVGARIDIHLTVGEGVVENFVIRKVDILDIREGENPQILVTMENTGNVPVAASRATFDLSDKYGQVRLGYGQIEKLPKVQPFETASFVVEFPIDIKLAIGEYWGEARIYRGTDVENEMRTVFNVTERKTDYTLYGGIAGGLLILIAVLFIIRGRKRRHA